MCRRFKFATKIAHGNCNWSSYINVKRSQITAAFSSPVHKPSARICCHGFELKKTVMCINYVEYVEINV